MLLTALRASDAITVLYHHNCTGEANIKVLMPFSVLLEHTLAAHPSQRMGGETELPALSFCLPLRPHEGRACAQGQSYEHNHSALPKRAETQAVVMLEIYFGTSWSPFSCF